MPHDLLLRPATPDDASAILAIYAPLVRDTVISFEEVPPTLAEMQARIVTTLKTYPFLVAEKDGELMGYVYASQHRTRPAYRWSVDVTVYIAATARRQGVGQTLYRELLRILQQLNYHAAFASIVLPNANSVRLHEAVGFQQVGISPEVGFKLGAWHSVGYWRVALNTANPPVEPIEFAAWNR